MHFFHRDEPQASGTQPDTEKIRERINVNYIAAGGSEGRVVDEFLTDFIRYYGDSRSVSENRPTVYLSLITSFIDRGDLFIFQSDLGLSKRSMQLMLTQLLLDQRSLFDELANKLEQNQQK